MYEGAGTCQMLGYTFASHIPGVFLLHIPNFLSFPFLSMYYVGYVPYLFSKCMSKRFLDCQFCKSRIFGLINPLHPLFVRPRTILYGSLPPRVYFQLVK